jgi:hypothetical protein
VKGLLILTGHCASVFNILTSVRLVMGAYFVYHNTPNTIFSVFCIFFSVVVKIGDLLSDKCHYKNATVDEEDDDDDDDDDVTFINSKV